MGDYRERIEINPKILLRKPVFKGTPVKKIIKFYPDLTEEDIRPVIRFASDTAKHIAEIKLETARR